MEWFSLMVVNWYEILPDEKKNYYSETISIRFTDATRLVNLFLVVPIMYITFENPLVKMYLTIQFLKVIN